MSIVPLRIAKKMKKKAHKRALTNAVSQQKTMLGDYRALVSKQQELLET
jgi:hypothetical protein